MNARGARIVIPREPTARPGFQGDKTRFISVLVLNSRLHGRWERHATECARAHETLSLDVRKGRNG
jgi:hypothetical protein